MMAKQTMLFDFHDMVFKDFWQEVATALVLAPLFTTFIYGSIIVLVLLELHLLRLVSSIFDQIFTFNQMVVLQKLSKMFFISSKKLFPFLRNSSFCSSIFPSFSPCQPLC